MHVGHGRRWGHCDGLGLEVGHALGLAPHVQVAAPLLHRRHVEVAETIKGNCIYSFILHKEILTIILFASQYLKSITVNEYVRLGTILSEGLKIERLASVAVSKEAKSMGGLNADLEEQFALLMDRSSSLPGAGGRRTGNSLKTKMSEVIRRNEIPSGKSFIKSTPTAERRAEPMGLSESSSLTNFVIRFPNYPRSLIFLSSPLRITFL